MRRFLFLVLSIVALGCRPQIGDNCNLSSECSPDGRQQRLCDSTSPDGYCTLSNCNTDLCPEEATCVSFQDDNFRFCMRSCAGSDECRTDDGYECIIPDNALGVAFLDSTPPVGYCGVP